MLTTKSNSMMAFTSVEDLTGTMEVIVFPRVLDTFRDSLHENAVVVIDGKLSGAEAGLSHLRTLSPQQPVSQGHRKMWLPLSEGHSL